MGTSQSSRSQSTVGSGHSVERDPVRPPLVTDQGNAANAQDAGIESTGPFLGDSEDDLAAWMSCEDVASDEDLAAVSSGAEITSQGSEIYGGNLVEPLSSGADIFELTVVEQPLIDAFDVMWECMTWPECGAGLDNAFEQTDLATRLRQFLEGMSLAGAAAFHTGWQWSGLMAPGLTQVQADVEFDILNPVRIATGAGALSASASGSVADAHTNGTELSAGAEFGGKVNYAQDEDAGKATAGVKLNESQTTTFTTMGSNGVGMNLPVEVLRGTLRGRPTLSLGGALVTMSRHCDPVEIGTITYARIAQ